MNVGDVREPKAVPAGRYDLIISEAKVNPAKSADKGQTIEVSIGIQGHLDAPNIRHFISLPRSGEEEKTTAFKKLMMKRFLEQFSIPYNDDGFDVQDFAGHEANCEVGLSDPEESKDNTIYN